MKSFPAGCRCILSHLLHGMASRFFVWRQINGIISVFYVSQEMLCHKLAALRWFRLA